MRSVRVKWPGGEHDFALPLGELRALQAACNAGPEEIFNRLRTGRWYADDIMHTLRQGLIGGGIDPSEASKLTVGLFDLHPLADFKISAIAVLAHALLGELDDPVGKHQAESPPRSGSSPKSTD